MSILDYYLDPAHFNDPSLRGAQGAQVGAMFNNLDQALNRNDPTGGKLNRTGYRINFNPSAPTDPNSQFQNAYMSSLRDASGSNAGTVNVGPGQVSAPMNAAYANMTIQQAAENPLMGPNRSQAGPTIENLLGSGGPIHQGYGFDPNDPAVHPLLQQIQQTRQKVLQQINDMPLPSDVSREAMNSFLQNMKFNSNFGQNFGTALAMQAANTAAFRNSNANTWKSFLQNTVIPGAGFILGGLPGIAMTFAQKYQQDQRQKKQQQALEDALGNVQQAQNYNVFGNNGGNHVLA